MADRPDRSRMNYNYLLRHISYHLHTIVRRYSVENEWQESFCARIQFQDEPVGSSVWAYFTERKEAEGMKNIPLLLAVNQELVYAYVPTPEYFFMIGPLRLQAPVCLKNQMVVDDLDSGWVNTVSFCEFNALITDMLLIYNLCQEEILEENDLLLGNCVNLHMEEELRKKYSELIFENREYGKIHNPYDQELREFLSIEHGDLENLKRSLKEDYPGEVGTLAREPLRHTKNRGIVVVTLASRAAVRGGLIQEIAFSLSDSYIQKIEECKDIPTVFHLFHTAEFQYAQMVREIREHKKGENDEGVNSHVARCKDYIFTHLHDKICVQEIARELGLNPNYLSELFHKHENIALTSFIINEKINLVKNMLIYSHYSYIEIASYLGFSSQSHLGKQFKKVTGMTLRQYRETYGISSNAWERSKG